MEWWPAWHSEAWAPSDALKAPTKHCKRFANRPKTSAKYCKPSQPTNIIIDCSRLTSVHKISLWVPDNLQTVYNDSFVEMNSWLWSGSRRGIRKLGRPLVR